MDMRKAIALVCLVAQTTTMVLVLRYSRTTTVDGPRFLNSTVVVVAELIKLLCCLAIITKVKSFNIGKAMNEVYSEIICRPKETFKIAIPSGLYAVQNNLLFIALTYLDAPTYQVTYQLKILSSAMFSVLLLGKSLNKTKWFALVLLTAGVALVQIPPDDSETKDLNNRWYGLLAIFLSSASSGFAGVYFEKLLKGSTQSLWIRNVQMALFGIIAGSLAVYFQDYEKVTKDGFFQGYSKLVWFVVLLHAGGGLLVSTVIKYADNIIKGFAASLSIVISSLLSFLAFDEFYPSWLFVLGSSFVLGATFMYGSQSGTPKASKQT